jgi:hypothetical protein
MAKYNWTLGEKRRDFCQGCNSAEEQRAERAVSCNLDHNKGRNLQKQNTPTREIG